MLRQYISKQFSKNTQENRAKNIGQENFKRENFFKVVKFSYFSKTKSIKLVIEKLEDFDKFFKNSLSFCLGNQIRYFENQRNVFKSTYKKITNIHSLTFNNIQLLESRIFRSS